VKEHHIRVARTARYYTLGSAGPHLREVWLVCHGYQQLAGRFLPRFDALDDGTRLIVAPEGLSRFYLLDSEGRRRKDVPVGATWMTREDREAEIADYVAFLDAVLDEVTDEVTGEVTADVTGEAAGEITPLTVLGFSQGAHTVCRWIAAGEADVERLILWGAYLPDDFDLDRGPDRLRSAELILVRGVLDHFISEEAHASQEARLEELAIPFRTITHAGGHELDPAVLAEIVDAAD
jgi:predicted esterase